MRRNIIELSTRYHFVLPIVFLFLYSFLSSSLPSPSPSAVLKGEFAHQVNLGARLERGALGADEDIVKAQLDFVVNSHCGRAVSRDMIFFLLITHVTTSLCEFSSKFNPKLYQRHEVHESRRGTEFSSAKPQTVVRFLGPWTMDIFGRKRTQI